MHELIRLLREYGADEQLITDVEAMLAATATVDGATVIDPERVDDETLDTILTALTALADDDETSAALLTEAAQVATSIRAESQRRDEVENQEDADRDAAAAVLRGDAPAGPAASDAGNGGDEPPADPPADPPAEDPDDQSADPPSADAGSDDAGTGADGAGAPATVPVAARSDNRSARRALRQRRGAFAQPRRHAHEDLSDIVFAADIPDISPGRVTHSLADVDRALEARWNSFRRSYGNMGHTGDGDGGSGGGEYLRVATIQGRFEPDRVLMDPSGDMLSQTAATRQIGAVLEQAIADARQQMRTPEGRSLVASGGICAPPTPIYNVVQYGDARRPVRDSALVSFQTPRGGVTDLTPPSLATVSAAASVWTNQNDIDAEFPPVSPTKPCLRVVCGAARTTRLSAFPICLTVGNWLSRTLGELQTAWSSLALVAQARLAEASLIAAMQTFATTVTSVTTDWSATRDVLNELSQAAWGMRSRHRMARDFPFRAVLPEILLGIMVTDISRQMPGGSTAENLAIAESTLQSFFAARNINVTWSPDMNVVGAQGATVLAHWPPTVNYLIYPEGTFIHLDGGELDLGVVRDSSLNSVNDFQVFSETFENVHMVGVEAIDGAIDVCPTGAVYGTIDPAPFCASYT
jgi:hypothetical protein